MLDGSVRWRYAGAETDTTVSVHRKCVSMALWQDQKESRLMRLATTTGKRNRRGGYFRRVCDAPEQRDDEKAGKRFTAAENETSITVGKGFAMNANANGATTSLEAS